MKYLNFLLITSLFITSLNEVFGQINQAKENDISESIKIKQLEEVIKISNSLNGIEITQQRLNFSDKKLRIEFLIETYENDLLTEEKIIFSGRTYHQIDSSISKYIDNLILAIKRENSNSSEFIFNFGSNLSTARNQIMINQNYIRPFGLKDFDISNNFELNKSIPFALYGAFWEFDFNGLKALRFCSTDKKLKSREDEQIYGKSPFYYVFSFRLTE